MGLETPFVIGVGTELCFLVLSYERSSGTCVLPGGQCLIGRGRGRELGVPAEMLPERRALGASVGTLAPPPNSGSLYTGDC